MSYGMIVNNRFSLTAKDSQQLKDYTQVLYNTLGVVTVQIEAFDEVTSVDFMDSFQKCEKVTFTSLQNKLKSFRRLMQEGTEALYILQEENFDNNDLKAAIEYFKTELI